MRAIPFEIVRLRRRSACRRRSTSLADLPRGLVLVTGPTGSGKSTTLASLVDIINATKPVHIMTVEDPIEFLHHAQARGRQPARGRGGHALVRRGAQARAAPGPRRHPRRRDARPRDDLDRADRGGDRPPRVRHAAHPGRAAVDRPHHRRVPARTSSSRCGCSSPPSLQGVVHPAARARRATAQGRAVACRGARRHAGGPQPHPRGQDPPDLLVHAGRREVRHGDDGPVARRSSCSAGTITLETRARALRQRRRPPPPDRQRS